MFENKFKQIFIENSIKIKNDEFTKYKQQQKIKNSSALNFKQWLMNLVKKEKDYFIKEALLDIIASYNGDNNYEAGLNISINNEKYSVYATKGIFCISANEINDNILKIILGE